MTLLLNPLLPLTIIILSPPEGDIPFGGIPFGAILFATILAPVTIVGLEAVVTRLRAR